MPPCVSRALSVPLLVGLLFSGLLLLCPASSPRLSVFVSESVCLRLSHSASFLSCERVAFTLPLCSASLFSKLHACLCCPRPVCAAVAAVCGVCTEEEESSFSLLVTQILQGVEARGPARQLLVHLNSVAPSLPLLLLQQQQVLHELLTHLRNEETYGVALQLLPALAKVGPVFVCFVFLSLPLSFVNASFYLCLRHFLYLSVFVDLCACILVCPSACVAVRPSLFLAVIRAFCLLYLLAPLMCFFVFSSVCHPLSASVSLWLILSVSVCRRISGPSLGLPGRLRVVCRGDACAAFRLGRQTRCRRRAAAV